MTRTAYSAVALIALLVLAGCAQPQLERDEPEQEEQAQVDDPIAEVEYTFEPVSTLEQVVGWPSSASSAHYFVSLPVDEACHFTESTLLTGSAIADQISIDELGEVEGFACGFTATPNSDDPDVLDEVAWRVDEGLAELVPAYAATAFADDAPGCETAEVPMGAPGVVVEHAGEWFLLRPAAVACVDVVDQIVQSVATLKLTEVLRHTTTFDDYLARGF